jgi:hypothetical protein
MKKHILLMVFWCFSLSVVGQNVTIRPNSITPSTSSVYQKLSYDAIQVLAAPVKGDMVYDLTFKCPRVYNGSKWVALGLNANKPNFASIREIAYLASLAFDGSNNLVVCGTFSGTQDFGAGNLSVFYLSGFLAKYSKEGVLLWIKLLAGSSDSFAKEVVVDASGAIYCGGNFNNQLTVDGISVNSTGSRDAYLIKVDSQGIVEWLRSAGGAMWDEITSIAVDPLGGVFVGGQFESSALFGSVSLSSLGQEDNFLAKFNASGAVTWAKRSGSALEDYSSNITSDASGNVYQVTNEDLAFPLGNNTVLRKHSNAGVLQWTKTGSDSFFSTGSDIIIDNSGNVLVVGTFGGTFTFEGLSRITAGSNDIFLLKYTSSGAFLAFEAFGGLGDESGYAIATDLTGNIYVGGQYQHNITINGRSAGRYRYAGDSFVFKLTGSFGLEWLETYGGTSTDGTYDIKVDSNYEIFLIGYTSNNGPIGNSSPSTGTNLIRLQQKQ